MQKKTRSPLLSARIDWIALEILIISGLTLIYTIIMFIDESKITSRTMLHTWKATVKEVVPFFHFAAITVVGAFELGGEFMLRYTAKIQQARDEGVEEGKAKGIEEGKAEGIEEGKAEGKAEGIEEGKVEGIEQGKAEGIEQGKAEIYQAWYADWERRKQDALDKGIPFNDPPPPKPDDIKEHS